MPNSVLCYARYKRSQTSSLPSRIYYLLGRRGNPITRVRNKSWKTDYKWSKNFKISPLGLCKTHLLMKTRSFLPSSRSLSSVHFSCSSQILEDAWLSHQMQSVKSNEFFLIQPQQEMLTFVKYQSHTRHFPQLSGSTSHLLNNSILCPLLQLKQRVPISSHHHLSHRLTQLPSNWSLWL